MNNKLKIGIDLDGVVADFCARFRQLAFAAFGKPDPSMSENTSWDFSSWGITPKEDAAIWRDINHTKNFWEHLGKMKGTENLRDAALDYQLYFITNRASTLGRTVEEQSCNWLVNNYDIKFPQVVVCKEKGLIAAGLELFAFIDDKPENCKMVQEGAPTCAHSTYIRDHLYNRGECGCKFIRVPTLDTFLERLP